MPNPLLDLVSKHLGADFVPRLRQHVVGLAEDYWADGNQNLLGLDFTEFKMPSLDSFKKVEPVTVASVAPSVSVPKVETNNPINSPKLWHAEPGEISEKMWGDGFVTPGDGSINTMLIRPLGLTKELSVLDLSAGLGGRMRNTAEETGAYITGLEPDPQIAVRGMQLSVKAGKAKHASITHYDPSKLVLNRTYDCIIARETFYRAPDRVAFFAAIAKHAKPRAQIAFTDYILDPEFQDQPAIMAWKKNEVLANPVGLVEMAELWNKAGFTLRVHEDLSDFYRAEVKQGMNRLMKFLASGVHPDKETGAALMRRVQNWAHRTAAMEVGLKFYRFYGTKR